MISREAAEVTFFLVARPIKIWVLFNNKKNPLVKGKRSTGNAKTRCSRAKSKRRKKNLTISVGKKNIECPAPKEFQSYYVVEIMQ